MSAKSRDVDETSSACDNDPCGEGNMCYERDRGHGCLCQKSPSQGRDCQETPQLLTFHGGNSSALFSAKHGEQNEIKIRFKASSDGLILFGSSKHDEGELPKVFYYLVAHSIGAVDFRLHYGSENHQIILRYNMGQWNTVTINLYPQKVSVNVNGVKEEIIRLEEVNFNIKKLTIGEPISDETVVQHIKEILEQNIRSFKIFVGQISEFSLNGKSLMDSVKNFPEVSFG